VGERLEFAQDAANAAGDGMPAVDARSLVKRFGDVTAVDGVDLEILPGEVRGLLGPNGAGKTTLLRMLFGLVRPDAGTIRLFGAAGEGDARVLDGVAGFVEEPSFYPYLSARRNLELLGRLDGDGAADVVDELLDVVGLGARGRHKVAGFSTGMRQRLGLAAALLRRPRLLLLDEPTIGLDPAGTRDMRLLIRRLAGGGTTILLSSHDMIEVEGMCDSVTIMRAGGVVWNGTVERLRAEAPVPEYRLSTSDDGRARAIAGGTGVALTGGDALVVSAGERALDEYVLALAGAGIAVRRLELVTSPLESMFFALTGDESRPAHEAPEDAAR